jgi:hypothetical protein
LNWIDRKQWSGQPSERGITALDGPLATAGGQIEPPIATDATTAWSNFLPADSTRVPAAAPRLMRDYEERHPLLRPRGLELLRERGAQRAVLLAAIIAAGGRFHKESDTTVAVSGERAETTEQITGQQVTSARFREIAQTVGEAAADTVRDFAEALLLSRDRLAVHADLLRDYTAQTIREIRLRIRESQEFASVSAPSWTEDTIAQSPIRACKEIIDARSLIENVEAPSRLGQLCGPAPSGNVRKYTLPVRFILVVRPEAGAVRGAEFSG